MRKWLDLAAAVIFGAVLLFGIGMASTGEAAPAPRAHHARHVSYERDHHGNHHHSRHERHHVRRHHPRKDFHPVSYHKHHRHKANDHVNVMLKL